ncbi:MAG: type II toxin-antitoxin system MqsA family antitoxin [Spirochaetales bacterium]|nr:type II toxin-antitoxin system MqsA family antitoxin [Spirochaetales bacterium]
MKKNTNSYFDSIMSGLNESLEFSKGNLKNVKKRRVSIAPIPEYNAKKIKSIRESLNLTQMIFAEVIGVSIKTVEAWESGRNKPQGPASRFLNLLEQDQDFLEEYKILSN